MNIETTVGLVEQWARDRNLVNGSDPKTQLLKTMSELGELADGIIKKDQEAIQDGLGDVLVTLIIVAAQCGYKLEGCLALAYNEIKDRKGVMFDGTFIKEGDPMYETAVARINAASARRYFGQPSEA